MRFGRQLSPCDSGEGVARLVFDEIPVVSNDDRSSSALEHHLCSKEVEKVEVFSVSVAEFGSESRFLGLFRLSRCTVQQLAYELRGVVCCRGFNML